MLKTFLVNKRLTSYVHKTSKSNRAVSQISRSFMKMNRPLIAKSTCTKVKKDSIYHHVYKNTKFHHANLQRCSLRHFSEFDKSKKQGQRQSYMTDEGHTSDMQPLDHTRSRLNRFRRWTKRTSSNFSEFIKDILRLDGEIVYK